MTPFPPREPRAGATNPPNPPESAIPSGNDGSGDLRAEALTLARLLDPVAFDERAKPKNLGQSWNQFERQQTAMGHAMTALIRGYRLVAEDDTTVERLSVAMHDAACGCGMTLAEHQASMRHDFDEEDTAFAEMARAAVRAIREERED